MKSSLGGGCIVENEQEKAIRSGRKIYYILSLAIFLGLIVLGSVLLGPKILEAAKDPDKFKELLGGSGIKSYLIFIAIQFVQIIFAFIPGEFIEVGAGYVYGSIKGLILCLIGAFLATAVIFGLTRIFGKRFTEMIIGKKDLKKLKFLHDEKKLELIFALLYFIPGTPKDLLTYFAGVTKIKFGTFMLISTFCRIPSIITSTMVGDAIGEERYLYSVIVFAITGAVGVGGYFLYHYLTKKHQKNELPDSDKKNK